MRTRRTIVLLLALSLLFCGCGDIHISTKSVVETTQLEVAEETSATEIPNNQKIPTSNTINSEQNDVTQPTVAISTEPSKQTQTKETVAVDYSSEQTTLGTIPLDTEPTQPAVIQESESTEYQETIVATYPDNKTPDDELSADFSGTESQPSLENEVVTTQPNNDENRTPDDEL